MTRAELESKIRDYARDFRKKVESAPMKWFGIGVGVGFLIAVLARVLVPLLLVFLLVAAGLYYFYFDSDPNL